MKKKLLNLSTILFLTWIAFSAGSYGQVPLVADSVSMEPGYINEIYYSMDNGTDTNTYMDSWDIAFRTMIMSSSIITNDGKQVILYTYPKSDTSGWASVDTSGLSSWKPMFNDPYDWENGAFMRNATGGLDFGWGVYNVSTHDLTGDSIYVIQLRDGSVRKLWIVKKASVANKYIFRFANIDGTSEQTVTLDCNQHLTREFIGYNLETAQVTNFQPAKTSWDILFTRYMSVQTGGIPYTVNGVLSNSGSYSQKFQHVVPGFQGYNPNAWDSTRSGIGWDWKFFDGSAFSVVDSLAYFVKTLHGDVYKLVFTKYEGSSTGKIVFKKAKIAGLGISSPSQKNDLFIVSPNPVNDHMNIDFITPPGESPELILSDLSGRTIYRQAIAKGTERIMINTTGISNGLYLIRVSSSSGSSVSKVIIGR